MCWQAFAQTKLGAQALSAVGQCRGFLTTAPLEQNRTYWKQREGYTVRPIGMKKTGGRDHSGEECGHDKRGINGWRGSRFTLASNVQV